MKIAILYIPVIHKGYIDFFNKHKDCERFFIIGNEFLKYCDYIKKEIRAITSNEALISINSLGFHNVSILTLKNINSLNIESNIIIIPDEDFIDTIVEKFLFNCKREKDTIFLRWNKNNINKQDQEYFDKEIEKSDLMNKAQQIAKKSSDWWRQIGAILLLKNNTEIIAHNIHLPTQHTPYINGDPRNASSKGKDLDIYSSIHAEAATIALAAKNGLETDGAEIYATTFPCPSCLRIIIFSGIKTIYYSEGYSILDGIALLKQYGVTIVKVKN